MKKIYLLLLLTIIALGGYSKDYRFEASAVNYCKLDDYGYWEDWTGWIPTELVITVDEDNAVNIFSRVPQFYTIIENLGTTFKEDHAVRRYKVIDSDGDVAELDMYFLKGEILFYIKFDNVKFVYRIISKE